MSGFDWIIAAVFLVSILVGIFRGFIKEFLSIVSWIAAIWLAITFCVEGGEFLAQYIDIPNLKFRTWAGFALIFISTLFLFAIISYIIAKVFVNGAVKGTDRLLGVGFGALRAAAIIVAFVLVGKGLGMESNGWWTSSNLISHFEPIAAYVDELLPEEWRTESVLDQKEGGSVQGELIKGAINNSVLNQEQ